VGVLRGSLGWSLSLPARASQAKEVRDKAA